MERKLKKGKKVYTISYDEYDELDTVACDGKFLVSTNKVVKSIIANESKIFFGGTPAGFEPV